MTGALTSKRIVNTRAAHQAKALDDMLQLHGAVSLSYPCIEIIPAADSAPLDKALFDLAAGHYEWLILTSANTVFALAERLSLLDIPLVTTAFRTAAIGPTTATSAKQLLDLDSIDLPANYDSESLAKSLSVISQERVLLPESNIARPILADMLIQRGAAVTVVIAYQTVCGSGGMDIPNLLTHQQIDAITFTSSSTVTYFIDRLDQEAGQLQDATDLCAACIGSKTAATARDLGFKQVEVASEHTLEGLIKALAHLFSLPTQRGNDS